MGTTSWATFRPLLRSEKEARKKVEDDDDTEKKNHSDSQVLIGSLAGRKPEAQARKSNSLRRGK